MAASALHLELVFSRPETTLSVTRGAARLMLDMGDAPLLEVCLPNGRRADVMALGSKGEWVTMGVPSNGEYGIPKDVIFGFPVTTENGKYKIVEGLAIDAFSQERIDKTLAELQGEQDGVKHLL